MAGSRHEVPTDLASLEIAYRKSRRTIIGHAVFFVVCCTVAVILRRMFNMPPALLTVVFFVALILFGGDILRFLSYRRQLRRIRENLN
jgi:hypothetical protein